MRLVDTVTNDGDEFQIETYELSMPHGPERNQHYETLLNSVVKRRYETEREALIGHQEMYELLEKGNYERECLSYRYILGDKE